MTKGEQLIAALVATPSLMDLDNCPAVPVMFGEAIYGAVQDDKNPTQLDVGNVNDVIGFSGYSGETALWHFATNNPVHHFVVIPWYNTNLPTVVEYTVFMAYENQYKVREYVTRTAPAPTDANGYKPSWSAEQISTMLTELLTRQDAWEKYFGQVGAAKAGNIVCYKYKKIELDKAIANVQNYP